MSFRNIICRPRISSHNFSEIHPAGLVIYLSSGRSIYRHCHLWGGARKKKKNVYPTLPSDRDRKYICYNFFLPSAKLSLLFSLSTVSNSDTHVLPMFLPPATAPKWGKSISSHGEDLTSRRSGVLKKEEELQSATVVTQPQTQTLLSYSTHVTPQLVWWHLDTFVIPINLNPTWGVSCLMQACSAC